MSGLKIYKEVSLPSTLETNSIYLISTADPEHVDVYVTGNTSGVVKRIFNKNDIDDIVSDALSGFTPESAITYGGNIDLNITPSGPEKLNTLFIVLNDYLTYKANDTLLKISNTEPYFVKLNSASSGGGSTPGEFSVIEWDPYAIGGNPIEIRPSNGSTMFSNGTLSSITPLPISLNDYDVGSPNSPNITFNNGSNGTDTFAAVSVIEGSSYYSRGFYINEITGASIYPMDAITFVEDGALKGSNILFILVQLPDGSNIGSIPVDEIAGMPNRIDISVRGLYSDGYNTYTRISYAIINNGNMVRSSEIYAYGDYTTTKFNISYDNLTIGNNLENVNLLQYGFNNTERYYSIGVVTCEPQTLSVTDTYRIGFAPIQVDPQAQSVYPDLGNMIVSSSEECAIQIDGDSNNPSAFFAIIFASNYDNFAIFTQDGQTPIDPSYVDQSGNIEILIDDSGIKLKNNVSSLYDLVHDTSIYNYTRVIFLGVSNFFGSTKTSWYYNILDWSNSSIINGTLPAESVDGSTIKVINNGLFDNKQLFVGDIVTPYSSKTKLIINRMPPTVSSDVLTAGTSAVTGNAVIAYTPTAQSLASQSIYADENNALNVKISNTAQGNILTQSSDGLYASIPRVITPSAIREGVSKYEYTGNAALDLYDKNIFIINCPSYYVTVVFSNLDVRSSSDAYAIFSKTITILVVNASSISWPSQINWSDGIAPAIDPNKYLLVNGIHIKSQSENFANNKILCTYSYFNKV